MLKKPTRESVVRNSGYVKERYTFEFEYQPPRPGETPDQYFERMQESFKEQLASALEGLADGSDPVLGNALEAVTKKVWPTFAEQRT